MKRIVVTFVCIVLLHFAIPGLGERAHHRRRSKLRNAHVVHRQEDDASSNQQQQQQQQQRQQQQLPRFVPELLDLTGSFSGTWTRLPEFDSSSSSSSLRRPPSTAVDADAAAALASQKLEDSGWPPILTRAVSGRLLLKLHSGPPNAQGVAGVEGLLSVSEGALVLGPALKRMSLSGITRLDASNNQGLYAVMAPQAPTRIAPPDFTTTPPHMGRATLSIPPPPQSGGAHQHQGSSRQLPQEGQQQQQQEGQHQHQWGSGWLPTWRRGGHRSYHGAADSFAQQLAWILGSGTGGESAAAAAAAAGRASSAAGMHSSSYMGECKFRLELTVSRADDFWVTTGAASSSSSSSSAATAMSAATAGSPRASMHSLHQKMGSQGPASSGREQQQQHEGAAFAGGSDYLLGATGPVVDNASKNFWGLSWQQYFGVEQQPQQPQQQEQQQEEDEDSQQQQQQQQQGGSAEEPPYPVSIGRRSAMEVPLPAGLSNTVLQIPLAPPGSPAIGIMDDLETATAADADYAAGYEAGYAAAAAEAEAAATVAVAAAEAARSAAAAIAALPRHYNSFTGVQGVGGGSGRTLKVRDFPGLDRVPLPGASAAAGGGGAGGSGGGTWQAHVPRGMMEQQQGGRSAPPAALTAAAPGVVATAPTGSTTGPAGIAAEVPSEIDSSSRYGVRNLFDSWLLPCSHPKQKDTPLCRQHLLSSALRTGSSSSTSARMEFGSGISSSRPQPRLHIQGLLVSDNCQAKWALSAVALPPGGLEVQALWYALLALLVCLVQVMLLRKQASIVTRSSAVALRVSLVGVCAGAQIDAFLSMAHLAASMSSPDISMPLLVVAAAQFALFAGADMTLLLHVWRAHDHHHQQQQRYSRPYTPDTTTTAAGTTTAVGAPATTTTTTTRSAGGSRAASPHSQAAADSDPTAAAAAVAESMAGLSTQWLAVGAHLGPYRPNSLMALWALPVLVVVATGRHVAARIRFWAVGGRGSTGLLDSVVLGIEQLATGRSLLMLYVRFYLVLLSATVLSWFMTSQLPLLLLAAYSFWIPQIWHNVVNTAKQPLQPGYVLVSTAARLLLPVYLLCCPLNLLQLTPQPWLAATLVAWVALQVGVLLLQHYTHPHVILPAAWAPIRYNYHRTEVPWQFKQAAAEAAAAAKAAACAAFDPNAQSLMPPSPMEQPAGGGSGHLTCCCTGISGACHLCSSRRYIIQETYGSGMNSCTIRFSPRRQSSAAGASAAVALRTNRAMLATETPLVATTGRAGSSGSSSSWRLQTATSAPQQQLQQHVQAAMEASSGSSGQVKPCNNCGGKLTPSCCNSFCSGGGSSREVAAGSSSSSSNSRWGARPLSQQDIRRSSGQQAPSGYPLGTITRSTSSGAQLQSHCQQQQQQDAMQQQQLVLSLPPGTSVELSTRAGCQHCCQCRQGGGASSSSTSSSSCCWGSAAHCNSGCSSSSSSSNTHHHNGSGGSHDESSLLHDVVEGYDAMTGDGVIECVICMAGVRLLPVSERFVTPCGHFFHPECLTSWMEVKAECPQCRGPLPPL